MNHLPYKVPDADMAVFLEAHLRSSDMSIRGDICEAHAIWFSRLRRAGDWWTGAERIAIAKTARSARTCSLCIEKKAALSPNSVTGQHDVPPGIAELIPAEVIDLVHRAMTDVTRMTKSAVLSLQKIGLDQGHYVEALGIAVAMINIDTFCRGMGYPQYPLDMEPDPGEPSRKPPIDIAEGPEFVAMIRSDVPEAPNEDLWSAGMVGNVYRALSYVPDAFRDVKILGKAHYHDIDTLLDFESETRTLSRSQREYIAARVSSFNECFY